MHQHEFCPLHPKTLFCQAHGNITSLANDFSISRKAVYAARDALQAALNALISDKEKSDCIVSVAVDKFQLRRASPLWQDSCHPLKNNPNGGIKDTSCHAIAKNVSRSY
jgi:hypothetical protein